MPPNFGVAITTLNRRNVYQECVRAYKQHSPPDAIILTVDDGSDTALPGATVRHPKPKGIASAKNASIRVLMDSGVDHLFLSDDDCWPTATNWWLPYTESGYPCLHHQPREQRHCITCKTTTLAIYHTTRGQWACTVCDPDVRPSWEDDLYFSPNPVSGAAGVLLYATRAAVNAAGGMREEFNRWSCESWEWQTRISNILGTERAFVAPKHSDFYSADACSLRPRSSVPREIRSQHAQRNWDLFQHYKNSKDFVAYKQPCAPATVCRPWRAHPSRVAGHDRAEKFWTDHGYPVVEADSDPAEPFCCSQARNRAAALADTDILIIADADTIPDRIEQVEDAIRMITNGDAEVVLPYQVFRHIPEYAASLPDYRTVKIQQEYFGSPGAMWVLTKATLERLGGFDERFKALMFDDTSFTYACMTLTKLKRVAGVVWSFNHKTGPDGKPERDYSHTNPNHQLYQRYQSARGNKHLMQQLVSKR